MLRELIGADKGPDAVNSISYLGTKEMFVADAPSILSIL